MLAVQPIAVLGGKFADVVDPVKESLKEVSAPNTMSNVVVVEHRADTFELSLADMIATERFAFVMDGKASLLEVAPED